MPFTAAKLGAVHASVIVVVRGRRGAGSWKLGSSACAKTSHAGMRQTSKPWWLMRLESIAYIFVGAFALLTLAFLVVLAPLIWVAVLHFAPGLEPLNRLITFGRFAIASLVLLLALVLAHKFLPAGRRSLRDIAPGILLTFALWIAASIAFGSYLAEFARNYVTTYAGLASVMIALVFLYMISSIFIFGGELNAAILRAKRKRNGNLKVARVMRGRW